MKRIFAIVMMLSIAGVAHAAVAPVPAAIPYQGHLTDAAGVDVAETLAVEVRLYDSLIAGIGQPISNNHVIYAESHPAVSVDGGKFGIAIGEGVPLDSAWSGLPVDRMIESESVYLELWVDGERLTPRQQLGSVPAAIRAGHAKFADEIADLGEISAAMMPAYDASRIASGTFESAQIPNLNAGIIEGTLAAGRIPNLSVSNFAETGELSSSLFAALDAATITDGVLGVERFNPANIMEFGDFAIATGTLTHGQHLNLPSEFDPAECGVVLSTSETVGAVEGIDRWDMYLNPSTGNLFCQIYEKWQGTGDTDTCNAHYLAVCKKEDQ